jgi:hypothetical protein
LTIRKDLVKSSIINDFYRKFELKDFEQVKILCLFAYGPGFLHSKKPVEIMSASSKGRSRSISDWRVCA